MIELIKSRPLSECSAKGPAVEVKNAVDLSALTEFFRTEGRMSRRRAQFMAREVYRHAAVSARWLPAGWHETLHPPAVSFMRRGAVLGELLTEAQHAAWFKAGGGRA